MLHHWTNRLLAALTVAVVIAGCGKTPQQPSAAQFASIVKAYTGGAIADDGAVKLELAAEQPLAKVGEELPADIFSFSPSVKGKAVWTSASRVEFTPEEGFKPGSTYACTVHMDKLIGVKDKDLAEFTFPVHIIDREASVAVEAVHIAQAQPDVANVYGFLYLSRPIDATMAKAILPEGAELMDETPATRFEFKIPDVPRGRDDSEYKIALRRSGGFSVGKPAVATIAGKEGDLRVISSRIKEGEENYIEVAFSEPIEPANTKDGSWYLEGANRYNGSTVDNLLRIYFDKRTADEMELHLFNIVQSVDGKKLPGKYDEVFRASKLAPAVEIQLDGNILPDDKQLILPFRAVSLNAVDVNVIKIYESNVLHFLQDNSIGGDEGLRRSGRKILTKTIPLDGGTPDWKDYSVDLSGLFKQEPGAIYRIRLTFRKEYSTWDGAQTALTPVAPAEEEDVWDYPSPWYYESFYDWSEYDWRDSNDPTKPSYYMQEQRFPCVNVFASNLGIIAKYAEGDKLWVAVSDIVSAKPIGGVDLDVYNYQLKTIGQAKTGSDGFADVELSGKPFILAARKGGVSGYLKLQSGQEKSLSRFDVGGRRVEKGLKGFVYGERGVWRPGDTLHVTLILHDTQGRIPEGHPASLDLYSPEGQFYCSKTSLGEGDGFYRFDIATRADDPTGIWNAYVKVGGASFHKALRIETVKPNRLKIETSLGTEMLLAGTKIPVSISSRWLTGPAASGLKADVDMTLVRRATSFPGFEGYIFTDPTSTYSSSEHKLFSGRLDGSGNAGAAVTVPSAQYAPGMLTANVLSTVQEEGGDESFVTMTVPFSPFSAYVGVKAPGSDLETDTDNVFKVAVVSPEGKRIAGHTLEYRIFKVSGSWWWEGSADELSSYVSGSRTESYAHGVLKSESSDVNIPLRVNYPDWGRFLVYVKDLDSGHASGVVSFVDWPAYRGRADRRDPSALTMITFATDKTSYEAGETCTVYVPAAANGRALISLENASGVISRNWVSTDAEKDTQYKFKVTGDMAPNFYIHMTLVQPHGNTANDLPVRMYGVQPVLVSDKATHLEPVLTVADSVHPEEEFSVKVSEKSGKPMTYTIAVVDEGLLDMTSFKTPDPWKAMYEREALGVSTFDMYDLVCGSFAGRMAPMLGIGGDEDMTAVSRRDNRFNPVVCYLGPFTLRKGSATHKVKLPMYVGSVRVMLVAGNADGAYGNAAKAVAVKSPLMVVPTLPRVLSTGESVTLPVNVFALEDGIKNAKVTVSVDGPVAIDGSAETSVGFDKPGDRMVRFALKASGEGFAHVTVAAAGNGQKTSETINIEVRNPNPAQTVLQRAPLAAGDRAGFSWAPYSSGHATLTVSGFPAFDFNSVFGYVRDYQYSCTEQLAARGINMTYTLDYLSEENAAKAKLLVPVILQQIYSRQLADGGFGYWPGQVVADPWVSSMAGQFLVQAKAKGFEVSSSVINNWVAFQKKCVQNWRKSQSKHLDDFDQAYRLYTLALAGKDDNASMNRLKESETLTLQARLMLASAYAVSGKGKVATELLALGDAAQAGNETYYEYYGSRLKDEAVALEALALAGDIPQALEMADKVADDFADGYYSTQELAFASVAMKRLADKVGTSSLKYTVDGKEVSSPASVGVSYLDPAKGSVSIANNSDAMVFASLLTVGKASGDVFASANGLKIAVVYTSDDGKSVSPAQLAQGQDFTATITVTNTLADAVSNIALVQMVPSGWEIRNERMTGAVTGGSSYDYKDIRDDRNIWYFSLGQGKSKTFVTKLRAAYEGSFTLPSVKCEAMYDASVFAQTASGKAVVTK